MTQSFPQSSASEHGIRTPRDLSSPDCNRQTFKSMVKCYRPVKCVYYRLMGKQPIPSVGDLNSWNMKN